MTDHRNDTRYKWIIVGAVIALILILSTLEDLLLAR